MSEAEQKIQFHISKEVKKNLQSISEIATSTAAQEMARQMEEVRKAAFQPMQRAIQDIEKARREALRPLQKTIQEMEEARRASFISIQKTLLEMGEIINSAKISSEINIYNFSSQHKILAEQIFKHQQEIAKNFRLYHFEKLTNFSESFNGIQSSLSILQDIQKFKFQNYEEINVETNPDNLDLNEAGEEFFQKLYIYFRDLISKLPKGSITVNGISKIYSALISTFLLLHAISQSQLNKNNIAVLTDLKQHREVINQLLKNILEVEKNLYPLLQDLSKTNKKELFLLTRKEALIRSEPTSKSDTLKRLPPNQELELVNSLNRWYYVKYFDFDESTINEGYIYKGNVKKVSY